MTNTEARLTRLAGSLCFAAAPCFAFMALLSALDGGGMICGRGNAFNGMTLMYLLMGAAHLPPWLRGWRS